MNTTIVEGPIERHKSRLAIRQTGDRLTGTYSGGSLNRTESVPKWSRERRAHAGLREAPRRDKDVRSSVWKYIKIFIIILMPKYSIIFGQSCARRVICNFNPLTKVFGNVPDTWSICSPTFSSTATKAHINKKTH